jgi:hypothetical protein
MLLAVSTGTAVLNLLRIPPRLRGRPAGRLTSPNGIVPLASPFPTSPGSDAMSDRELTYCADDSLPDHPPAGVDAGGGGR